MIGDWNEEPILNTALYDVEFPDGAVKPYGANVIAENILNTVDEEGMFSQFLEGVVGHRRDKTPLTNEERYFFDKKGERHEVATAKEWDLQVKFKDGTVTWKPLKLMKESNRIEVASYVEAVGISKNQPLPGGYHIPSERGI